MFLLGLRMVPEKSGLRFSRPVPRASKRQFLIDNLLLRSHLMIRWTGLAPWEFEFPFLDSLTSTCLWPLPLPSYSSPFLPEQMFGTLNRMCRTCRAYATDFFRIFHDNVGKCNPVQSSARVLAEFLQRTAAHICKGAGTCWLRGLIHQPTSRPINQHTNQTTNNKRTNRQTSQPANQPTNQPTN